ncbi:MAG: hypothetical protein GY749_11360 [Desulfobacteraceae bacterium]|nr:hypothetical protein [Desulfobacteraceae bacterium]
MTRPNKEIQFSQLIVTLVTLFFFIFPETQAAHAQPALSIEACDAAQPINNCEDVTFKSDLPI